MNQREMISVMIKNALIERTSPFWIQIEDLSLMDLHFSGTFQKAVEDKQIAQQSAERAKFTVEKAFEEKKSSILKAEADARSIELIGEQLQQNPSYLQLQKIEVAKNVSLMISQSKNKIILPADALMVNLNEGGLTGSLSK